MRDQPFNEDHPDFEQYVQSMSEEVDGDRVIQMMQLAAPTEMLHFLLQDETRNFQQQVKGVIASGLLALVWISWPVLGLVTTLSMPTWCYITTGVLSGISGVSFGYHLGAVRHRWQRYQGFIKPAHQALHKVMGADDE